AFAFSREREGLTALLAQARPTESEAAQVASEVASIGSVVVLPGRELRFRVPRTFTIEVREDQLLLHAPSEEATLLAAHRATNLDPAHFLAQVRQEYAENLRAQLGVEPTSLAWSEPERLIAGAREGVRARLVVT